MEAGAKPPAGEPAPAKPGEGAASPGAPAPEPVTERVEGLRAWVAQLDRKLGVRSYAVGAAVVLALAAGIVAIVLVLGVKEDGATDAELERVRDEVAGVEEAASQAAQDEVTSLGERVSELENQLQGLRSDQDTTDRELSVIQDDIADLRDEISQIDSSGDGDNP